MSVNVNVRKIGTMLVAEVHGDLDMVSGAKLKESADKMWDHYETLNCFVLDLSNVGFNDSTGLGAILGRYKKVNARNGTMIIVGAKGSVKDDLEISGISRLCSFKESLKEVAPAQE
ncbi:MAG: STAS domain-containing protein [Firmicutes bacterium]|nr:STAS domain-containing protein [Bacillota bacterium]MDD4693625.1 STAS domain-containing protein [Bacillota bacterium]